MERPEIGRVGRVRRGGLVLVGLLSLAVYLRMSLLRGWSQPWDVYSFVGLLLLLFGLYAAGIYFGSLGAAGRGSRPGCIRTILLFALLFRLALLPAGLGDDPGWGSGEDASRRGGIGLVGLWSGLASDFAGQVPYSSHLLYDNDVWRYLWDGHQTIHGLDPYIHTPAEALRQAEDGEPPFAELLEEERWQDVHDNVAFQGYRTVYPPLAQLLFQLSHRLAPASVAAWKLLLIGFDLGTCLMLLSTLKALGRPRWWVMIYAWNPLTVEEIAGSGHVDGLLVFCLTAAIGCWVVRRPTCSLLALSAAILTKLTPLLVVPLFLRRTPWRSWWILPAAGALAYAPYFASMSEMVEALGAFASQWVFNPGAWLLFETLSQLLGAEGRGVADALSVALTLGLGAGAWFWLGGQERAGVARDGDRLLLSIAIVLGGYLLLSATVMPWYLLWILPVVALMGPGSPVYRPWLAMTAVSPVSYLIYVDGVERTGWLVLEHGLVWGLVLYGLVRPRQPGSRSDGPITTG